METEALFAEYARPGQLAEAVRRLRTGGFAEIDAYTAYPVPEVIEALDMRRSRLPVVIFVVGMSAAGFTFLLQWLLVGYLYPLNVGGRPPFMPLPFLIITFEMGVLFAVFAAFFGVFVKARLLRLWDPVFEVPGFERVSIDRHWLRVGGDDPRYDPARIERLLAGTGALRFVRRPGGAT